MKNISLLFILVLQLGFSQHKEETIYNRITTEMQNFVIDTTTVPNDMLSKKIRELRDLKGGFNINEAMDYKIIEALQKKEISQVEYDNLKKYLTTGNGKKWIDNSMIWIYRKKFNYKEIKQLIRFYKTSAGKNMAINSPIIIVQSIKSAEAILENYKQKK